MKKVILDEKLPHSLSHHLAEFDGVTVQYRGWADIQNEDPVALIDGKYDVFLTADQNLRYQQNLMNRSIAIVELQFIGRRDIPKFVRAIRAAIIPAKTATTSRSSPNPQVSFGSESHQS